MADDLTRVGLVFKTDGAADFVRTTKEVNASMQENRSAFKLAQSAWDESTSSSEKLRTTQKYLEQQTKDYTDKVKSLQRELDSLSEGEGKNSEKIQKKQEQIEKTKASVEKYQNQCETLKKELAELEKDETQNADAIKKKKEELDKAEQSLGKSEATQKKYETQLKSLEAGEENHKVAIARKQEQINTAEASLNGYKKGLQEVTDKLKSGRAEIEEYAKKVQALGDKMTSTGKTLSKNVTAPIVAVGGLGIKAAMELDEGYDTIISKTGATGEKLQEFQDIADEVFGSMPAEMTDVGAAVGEINTRLGFTGDALSSASKDFLKFAEINNTDVDSAVQLVTRAMGDAGIEADQYGSLLDELTTASQASGISIDTLTGNLAKYGAPMRALGLSTQESIALFAGWEKAGVNTEIAFSGMKKAIGTWGKEGKDPREEFKKTLVEIENCPDIATATTKAIEVFGQKAGPDLADAIQGGRFAYEDYLNLLEQSGGIVESTWDAQQNPWDEMKTAVNDVKLAGAELGSTLAETLMPMVKGAAEAVREFAQWFKGLDDNQKKTIVTIAMVVAAIGPLLIIFGSIFSGISKIIGGVSSVIGVVTKAGPVISTVLGGIGTGAKALFGIIAANPIIAIIGVIVAAVVALYNNCEWFRDGVNAIFSAIGDAFHFVWDGIATFFTETLPNAWNSVVDFFSGVPEWWSNLWGEVGGFFSDIGSQIKDVAGDVASYTEEKLGVMKQAYEENGGGIKGIVAGMAAGVSSTFSDLYNGLNNLTGGKLGEVVSGVQKKVADIKKAFEDKFGAIKDFVRGAIDKIKGFFDFDWKLPDIKLPHFNFTGKFSLSPFEVPKLDVQWYAKGGILNSPTIFGAGSNGSLLGGGEAGQEAVLPITKLKEYIREELARNNQAVVAAFKEALKEMNIIIENNVMLGNKNLTDALVETIIKKISAKQSDFAFAKG